jgi:23S rRNA pseudouridine2605 synthase
MATKKTPAKSAPVKAAAPKKAKKQTIETPVVEAETPVIAAPEETQVVKAPAKKAAKKQAKKPVEVAKEEEPAEDEIEEEDDDLVEDEEDEDDEDDEEEEEDDDEEESVDPDFVTKPRPPANLVRLQKILAAAGIASRRRAEELIEQGRVQVNGKIVTELGTKADAGRDHIRVDGKLLQGAERLRYYVLNKPKGFVTTVKDPEGRPTVMQFFEKMKERLYPVGRLDYMSEGLLLVTNDGELANRLTKASSGVEKTYLVKVAGQPTEDELDLLRGGVSISRGKDGTDRVKTAPARIRQVRQGDNPWFEVVLIEGRNRELRKMFEEIGHFVEKIRRIGYGPLVLDQEPGNLRELDEQELSLLRLAAEGKLRTPKAKDTRRRNLMDAQVLPTIKPRTNYPKAAQPFDEARPARPSGQGYRPAPARPTLDRLASTRPGDRSQRPGSSGPSRFGNDRDRGSSRPSFSRPDARPSARPAWQEDVASSRPAEDSENRPSAGRTFGDRPAPARSFGDRPPKPFGARPSNDRPARPFGDRPSGDRPARPFGDRPGRPAGGPSDRPAGRGGFNDRQKPFGDRPGSKSFGKPGGDEKWGKRNVVPQRADDNYDDLEPRKPVKIFIEPVANDDRPSRPSGPRPTGSAPYSGRPSAPRSFDRPQSDRPGGSRPSFNRSSSDRPSSDRPARPSFNKPSYDRPRPEGQGSERPASPRPFRSEGGLERRFTTSSGMPRPGGARPNNKSGKPGGGKPYGNANARPGYGAKPGGSRPAGGRPSFARPEGQDSGARSPRPFTPRAEGSSDFRPSSKPYSNSGPGSDRKGAGSWKPKPSGGARSKPGGFSKPGGGFKGGSRPSGGRPGGAPGGKKRY